MLAIAAGQFRGPNYRGLIKEDMDLRDRLPPDATARRAELQLKEHRSNWLAMFILLIVLSVVAAVYALRGVLRAASSFVRRQHA